MRQYHRASEMSKVLLYLLFRYKSTFDSADCGSLGWLRVRKPHLTKVGENMKLK